MKKEKKENSAPIIKFEKVEKDRIVKKIQLYFQEELEQKIGAFDAEFLLDFFSDEIGVYFYNRGIYDAQTLLEMRIDDLRDAILELEKATDTPYR